MQSPMTCGVTTAGPERAHRSGPISQREVLLRIRRARDLLPCGLLSLSSRSVLRCPPNRDNSSSSPCTTSSNASCSKSSGIFDRCRIARSFDDLRIPFKDLKRLDARVVEYIS